MTFRCPIGLASTAAFRQPRPSRSTIDADARHLFSRGAVRFQERLVWRCVDRRREEPAARRRAIDEQFCPGPDQSVRSPCGKKSTKPLVPLHSNPGQQILEPVWRRVATESLADWARSSRYRFRHSSNSAIHTSKTIVNESNLLFLARRPMRRAVLPLPRRFRTHLPFDCVAGLVLPRCEPSKFPSGSGRKR